jgi:hypothetical protein
MTGQPPWRLSDPAKLALLRTATQTLFDHPDAGPAREARDYFRAAVRDVHLGIDSWALRRALHDAAALLTHTIEVSP